VLVTHERGKFYRVDHALKRRFASLASIEANVRKLLPGPYCKSAKWICDRTNSAKIKKWLLPEAGHLGAFKLAHNLYESAVRKSIPLYATSIQPCENDLFLLPDAYWTKREVWKAATAARQAGATIVTVIYDLIPLTHPQYVGTRRMEGFRRYLHNAIEHSDAIVAISRTVQEELTAYIHANRQAFQRVPYQINHFTLGAELSLKTGVIRPEVESLFSAKAENANGNPYLMVATFDPRKNHHYLLDAFDLLWNQGQDLRLCLIGRVGSLCEDVVQRIRQHPGLNRNLFAFFDVKDAELQHCYQHCRGVVFPSIVEGFGLPIVESLWFGKRTFASNTPIHREVGQHDCVYFDLASPQSLADEILRWESVANRPWLTLPTRRPTTWAESSRQLIAHCIDAHASMPNRQPLRTAKAA
jgi:alpha-1,2-rhamnosyltransferase